MSETLRTYEDINKKIKNGDIVVVTADKMSDIVENDGIDIAARDIDVVTTGTFGAMCSSGAFLNFGHADPPIKMEHVWLNDVHAYHGNAAVDCYLGVTRRADTDINYGGGHVIESLVAGEEIHLRATAYATDCYPRTRIDTDFRINDINQAILTNPRNAYQRYVCATNGRDETIYTYMGKLLPNYTNATYSGAGVLSPLSNDPDYETIGIGTRIFLGGGIGYITSQGTQHSPKTGFGTIFVSGDLKQMKQQYLRGATFKNYGTTLYVGLGIPIPILNKGLAKKTAIKDEEILTDVLDYGVGRRTRPILRKVNYKELKSGKIQLGERDVRVSSLSNQKLSKDISELLQKWIENDEFYLTKPAEKLPTEIDFKPMKMTEEIIYVRSIMRKAFTITIDTPLESVANKILNSNVNHHFVIDNGDLLKGIVTSFDITRAVAKNKKTLEDIVVKKVISIRPDEEARTAARVMEKNNISALAVIDKKKKLLGMISSEDLSKLLGKYKH
ncbi:MAG: CBS domain-containing protein [Candidatus Lokiarchaeota archaeon]|nr:CBS domain-containing protein [Candidatus Lokiarchaeota archaeon]